MLEFELRVQHFCQTVVQKVIDDDGFAFVNPSTGIILFYAGPSDEVIKEVKAKDGADFSKDKYPPNWTLAKEEADRLGALRIDDAVIFPILRSVAFKRLLTDICLLSTDEINPAIQQVWNYTK